VSLCRHGGEFIPLARDVDGTVRHEFLSDVEVQVVEPQHEGYPAEDSLYHRRELVVLSREDVGWGALVDVE